MLVKSVYAVCVSGLPSSSRCCVTPCSLQHHGAMVHWDLLSAVLFYVYDSAESLAFFFFFLGSEHPLFEVKDISSSHKRVPHFNQAFCSLRAADGGTTGTSTEHLFFF